MLLAALLTGCGDDAPPPATRGTSVAAPGPSCSPAPAVAPGLPAAFPLQLPLPAGAVVTGTGTTGGSPYVTARVAGDVPAVLAHFRAALAQAGAVVGRDEDEGRAGTLTFLGGSTEGVLTVARQRCPAGSVAFTLAASRTR